DFDYRALLDTMADAVLACGTDWTVVYANAAVEGLLGWSAPALVGQSLEVIIPQRLREGHREGLARYLETRPPTSLGRPTRMPAVTRDGLEIEVELTISQAPGPDGQVLLLGSLRDLRDRVELESQLTLTRYLRATARAATHLGGAADIAQ